MRAIRNWIIVMVLGCLGAGTANAVNAPLPDWMQRVHIGGNAAMRYMNGQPRAQLDHNGGFMVYEAGLVFDIDIMPNASFWYDTNLIREGISRYNSIPNQQLYVRWDNILNKEWLNGKLGRTFVPFGEEYLHFDAIDKPLASASVADIWGLDEGVLVFGDILPKSRLSYVVGVQNGDGNFNFPDNPSKSVAVKMMTQMNSWAYLSGSYMYLGRRGAVGAPGFTELWSSGFNLTSVGTTSADSGASPSDFFLGQAFEGDLRLTPADIVELTLTYGYIHLNDGAGPQFNRTIRYYSGELLGYLPKTAEKAYLVGRYSIIGTMSPTLGYHFAGTEFAANSLGNNSSPYDSFDFDQRDLHRTSLGAGYRFHPNAVVKVEYSWEGTHLIESAKTPANLAQLGQRDFFITEVAFRF